MIIKKIIDSIFMNIMISKITQIEACIHMLGLISKNYNFF